MIWNASPSDLPKTFFKTSTTNSIVVKSSLCRRTRKSGGFLNFSRLSVATSSSRPYSRSDRKSTRLNSSHLVISYAVFCLKKNNHYDTHGPTVHRPTPGRPLEHSRGPLPTRPRAGTHLCSTARPQPQCFVPGPVDTLVQRM